MSKEEKNLYLPFDEALEVFGAVESMIKSNKELMEIVKGKENLFESLEEENSKLIKASEKIERILTSS